MLSLHLLAANVRMGTAYLPAGPLADGVLALVAGSGDGYRLMFRVFGLLGTLLRAVGLGWRSLHHLEARPSTLQPIFTAISVASATLLEKTGLRKVVLFAARLLYWLSE